MNKIKKYLYKLMLPKLTAKSCESRIPRSGVEGEAINCYIVALDRDNNPFFVATSYQNNILNGVKWDGDSYSKDFKLSLDDLDNGEVRITHYYGLSEITFSSIYDVAWHYFTRIIYFKINISTYIYKSTGYFFKKRKIVTKKRMELLQFLLDNHLKRQSNHLSYFDSNSNDICSLNLMTKLYSIHWVSHPSGEEQKRKLELYLESLIATGELKKTNDNYYLVTGKAISTIEKYEEEERKHSEIFILQILITFLTLIIAIATVVQSGILKFPTIFDFSTLFK